MKKQTQSVGRLLALVVLFSTLSACERLNAVIADGRAFVKAIVKADEKNEEVAEADKAAAAKATVRRLLGDVDVLLAGINKSNADLSKVAQEIKPLLAQVAMAQAAPQAEAPTPTCFVGLGAKMVLAEKRGGELEIVPLYLANNQALHDLGHQVTASQGLLTDSQVMRWRQAHNLLFKRLDELVQLMNELWTQNPDSAGEGWCSSGFLSNIVEIHLDNAERNQVCANATAISGTGKKPVPAWFEQTGTLGLTPAAKKLLAE